MLGYNIRVTNNKKIRFLICKMQIIKFYCLNSKELNFFMVLIKRVIITIFNIADYM